MDIKVTETTATQTTVNLLGNSGWRQSDLAIRPLANGSVELQMTADTHLGAGDPAETSEAIVVTAKDIARLEAYLVRTASGWDGQVSLGKGKIKIKTRSLDNLMQVAGGLRASLGHSDLAQLVALMKG